MLHQFPLYRLFQIVLSVFPASSDASTHFHIEIPSMKNKNTVILVNLQRRPLKLGILIVSQETRLWL